MNIDSESTIESNEIYNESVNKYILSDNENDNSENDNNENNDNENNVEDDDKNLLIDDDDIENSVTEEQEKKICGYNKFKEEIGKLDIDSFDESSEYSYESIPEVNEAKKSIDYLYIVSLLIGLFLIYYFYSGNIFITIIELVLNMVCPYIYIVVKLFLIKGKLVEKIKRFENNK